MITDKAIELARKAKESSADETRYSEAGELAHQLLDELDENCTVEREAFSGLFSHVVLNAGVLWHMVEFIHGQIDHPVNINQMREMMVDHEARISR